MPSLRRATVACRECCDNEDTCSACALCVQCHRRKTMRISLTDFVDLVARTGPRKASKVAQLQARQSDPYHPCKDFYKPVRDSIVAVHRRGERKAAVTERLAWAQGSKREARQTYLAGRYQSWWGRKNLVWVEPRSAHYEGEGVCISVNPELGLLINGRLHIVKLYFKADRLEKQSAELIIGLMELTLGSSEDATFSVLDVERRRLFTSPGSCGPGNAALIEAELAWISRFCGFDARAA